MDAQIRREIGAIVTTWTMCDLLVGGHNNAQNSKPRNHTIYLNDQMFEMTKIPRSQKQNQTQKKQNTKSAGYKNNIIALRTPPSFGTKHPKNITMSQPAHLQNRPSNKQSTRSKTPTTPRQHQPNPPTHRTNFKNPTNQPPKKINRAKAPRSEAVRYRGPSKRGPRRTHWR
jgi:hypothetical protein